MAEHKKIHFDDMPNDILALLSTLLPYKDLFFFAQTSKKCLRSSRQELIKLRQILCDSLSNTLIPSPYLFAMRILDEIYAFSITGIQKPTQKIYKNTFSLMQEVHNLGKIKQIAPADGHMLVLSDRGLFTYGANAFGQLGIGSFEHGEGIYHKIDNISGEVLSINTGVGKSFALTTEGLYGCGLNHFYGLGIPGDSNQKAKFTKLEKAPTNIIKILSCYDTYVLTSEGLYFTGVGGPLIGEKKRHFDIPGLSEALVARERLVSLLPCAFERIQSVPGKIFNIFGEESSNSVFVTTNQGVYAYGNNSRSKLGLGDNSDKCSTAFTKVESLPGTALKIAVGSKHTLVLTDQGLYSCGNNENGELGLGNYIDCNTFIPINIAGMILDIAIIGSTSFVLTEYGLFGCGKNPDNLFNLEGQPNTNRFTQIRTPDPLKKLLSQLRQINLLINFGQIKPQDQGELSDQGSAKVAKFS